MVNVSRKDLEIIAIALGGIDFYLEGALTTPVSRALKSAVARVRPVATRGAISGVTTAARTLPRFAGTAALIGKQIALRHPVLTAGAVIYYTYKNRDEIADLVEQGYEVLQANVPEPTPFASQFVADPIGASTQLIRDRPSAFTGRLLPKKRKSAYNSSVSKAMKALKNSTSYGKKGILSTPKKAFGFVARTVSKLRKGKKVPSKGASGVVKRALPGISKITVRKP